MGDTGTNADDGWESYYCPLVRLAALLTSDIAAAEAVAEDALAAVLVAAARPAADEAASDFLTRLQREVVARSRRTRYYRKLAQRGRAAHRAAGQADALPDFSRLPVVAALRGLSARLREAIVLSLYLELPEARAAAVAGVTESALRANLAAALRALGEVSFTTPCPGA